MCYFHSNKLQINLESKTGVKKVTEENIKSFVESESFCNAVGSTFHEEMRFSEKRQYNRPGYSKEIGMIQETLNCLLGKSWRRLKRKNKIVKFGDTKIETPEYPWNRIAKAHKEFPKWHSKHAKIFDFQTDSWDG